MISFSLIGMTFSVEPVAVDVSGCDAGVIAALPEMGREGQAAAFRAELL